MIHSVFRHAGRVMAAQCLLIASVGAALPLRAVSGAEEGARKPNIVVILSDDQGYADISFNPLHPPEVSTPYMDALAREGVFFKQAYISGNVCSPTRTGLMTGRYQQRVGIYTGGEGGSGLPLTETIFPQRLKPAGYVCGAFGKWHLGLTEEYNPASRGFDTFYGFLGRGAHDYFKLDDPASPIYRGLEPFADHGYLTNRLTDEAVAFIQKNKAQPFFCYLAYNAVHFPPEAPEEDTERYRADDPARNVLMAMLLHLDNGVGRVVETLKQEGLWENTLLIFLTDNGGSKAMHAINTPLRGFKTQNYEGGIRTPFVASWPARFQGGRTIDTPIISLDILATALDAAGLPAPTEKPLDGKSILPVLSGEAKTLHEDLFWSEGGSSGEWALRSGQWKLVVHKEKQELYDLQADPSESKDIAADHPDQVQRLNQLYDAWLDQMAEPMHGPGKRWEQRTLTPEEQKRAERTKERKQSKPKKQNAEEE